MRPSLRRKQGNTVKGICLVAAEIRELANRTSTSTHGNWKKLIHISAGKIREAVGVMREEVTMVEEGVFVYAGCRTGTQKRSSIERIFHEI